MSGEQLWPGDVVVGRYKVGRLIGAAQEPGTPCDAPNGATVSMLDGSCRCTVCPRCDHHTGNAHQGHYWGYCQVTGTTREFHLCCPGDCELEAGTSANSHNRKD